MQQYIVGPFFVAYFYTPLEFT